MRSRIIPLLFEYAGYFIMSLFVLACVHEIDSPDPETSKEVNEQQYESDHASIIDVVSSCITDSFNAESLIQGNIDKIIALPSVKAAEVTSAGVYVTYVDDSVEYFLFDYGTAFDDENSANSTVNVNQWSINGPMDTKATGKNKIHIFNLFSNDNGRKNQNQLMKSVAKQFSLASYTVIEHPFSDFSVNTLVLALEDKECVAIFISTLGDESGHIAIGGEYYKKYEGYGMPNSSVAGEIYVPLTPAGKNQVGNTVNQLVGHTYRGANLHYFLKNISSDKLAGKMLYLSSCHSLRADYDMYNVCMVGWDNVNMLGEAYALIMANYLGNHYFTLGSFLANFKNSVGGIEDKYTNSGATLRVKGRVKDFSFFPKDICFAEPERGRLKPHKIQITSPENGGCVNPFAIYSAGIGGNELVYFDYILDSGETVNIWNNTTPQGRVYFTRSMDFVEKDMYGVPLGMYKQSKLNPYVVTSFFSPGVMRLEFYSQKESDYKENGPSHYSHKLEDAVYLIAPRNYHKNDPVQNHDPSVTTLTVLNINGKMYAYGGVLNMDGDQLKKGFKLSEKGANVDLRDDVPATNDGNLFYAPLPNLKKGVEYTVIAYAMDKKGTFFGGEPYDFVSEVDSVIPTEPTPGDLIDLGLSVKWASCNLGASEPQEPGDYYAWGETQTKSTYNWSTYRWSNGTETSLKKYCTQSTYGTVDNKISLDLSDDAAYANSQGKLRMPSSAEWRELSEQCQWTKTQYKGKDGFLVSSAKTDNAIFIPCNGIKFSYIVNNDSHYYWTSDLNSEGSRYADAFLWPSVGKWNRCDGLGIRPVSSGQSDTTADNETITVNGVSFKMIKVEGGSFMMGAPKSDRDASSDEMPQHRVTLDTYSIGQTEVTQALWEAVMGSNPSNNKSPDNPVEYVSRNDMKQFISKLNKLTGRHFRLPTEAEWEYAARGGKKSNGYKYAGSDNVSEVAWFEDNSFGATHPVAQKRANELGIYDMSGNVWEPCLDYWDPDYYNRSPEYNPYNQTTSSVYLMRGGGLSNEKWFCRVSQRADQVYLVGQNNMESNFDMGLRLVLSDLFISDDDNDYSTLDAIDLGLSVMWSSFNLGATKPEEYGDFYAWGETEPKGRYFWDTYKWGDYNNLTKYNSDSSQGVVDNKTDLSEYDYEDDAAHVKLGAPWRIPTVNDYNELISKCQWLWSSRNGINGYEVTGPSGNSIFLPAGGYWDYGSHTLSSYGGDYWASSISRYDLGNELSFNAREYYVMSTQRSYGNSIRPVCPKD